MVPQLRISQLAKAGGASPKTIRYYEEIGLLPTPQRAENGYRLYDDEDVRRLRFIRNARNLGFSLENLREVLALRDEGDAPCHHVGQVMEAKVVEIEERIRQLRGLQSELQTLLQQAETLPNNGTDCVCNLIYHR